MGETSQIERFAELVRRYVILRHPIPKVEDLATEFQVSRRTIFRDLKFVRKLSKELNNFNHVSRKSRDI